MGDAEEVLNRVLNDPTVCSRCFNKVMDSQQRSGTTDSSAPCSESCGQLGISMESEIISSIETNSRAKKLLSILKEKDIEIEEEAFMKAVEYYSNSHPPREILVKAIAFGIGERDVSEIKEEDEEQLGTKTENYSDTEAVESKDPIQLLADGTVTKSVIEEITDVSVQDKMSSFETPDSVEDIYYLDNPEEFEAEYDVDESGDHTDAAVAASAVRLTWTDDIQTSTLQKWINRMDNKHKRLILSAAVRNGAPQTLPVDIEPWESFRSTNYWPVVKQNISQPVLSYIKRQKDNYVRTSEIAAETGFDEEVVRRVLYVLYENETVEPDEDGNWKYVEETRFREDKVPDDR